MRATAQRSGNRYRTTIAVRGHELTADEPAEKGGEDQGPDPQELLAASLAACTAITLDMYVTRKGWEIGDFHVACEYESPRSGSPTIFRVDVTVPSSCSDEQLERLRVMAAKCPVHRILEGEVEFEEQVHVGTPSPR